MLPVDASFEMATFGALVARLGVEQPGEQVVFGPDPLWEEGSQYAADLRASDLGQIPPPSPAGGAAGRHRRAKPGRCGGANCARSAPRIRPGRSPPWPSGTGSR